MKLNFIRSKWLSVPDEKRLSREAIISLIIHSCFQFGASMSAIFLNLYLWRLTESLYINGMYYVCLFAITPLAFAVGGWIAKKKDRLFTYRAGIMLIAIFYLMVVIAQERVVDYFVLFGIFNGIAASFYWTGYLTLMYDVSTEANRIRYLAINMITFSAAGLAGPALAGFIIVQFIGLQGYVTIFAIAFIMFVLTAIISLRLKLDATHHKSYYLSLMGLVLRKYPWFRKSLYAFFVFGMLQGLMIFLPFLLLYRVFPREDIVGYLGVLFLGLSIISSFFISRYAKEIHLRRYILISGFGFAIGSALLLIHTSMFTVLAFLAIFWILQPLHNNSMSSYYYKLISRLPLKGQLRVESVVLREVFVNAGRIVAILLLIFLAIDLESIWLPRVLFLVASMQLLMWFLVRTD